MRRTSTNGSRSSKASTTARTTKSSKRGPSSAGSAGAIRASATPTSRFSFVQPEGHPYPANPEDRGCKNIGELNDAAPVARREGAELATPRPSKYECPRHRLPLVPRVLLTTGMSRAFTNIRSLHYFGCTVEGCNFAKPNKWISTPCRTRSTCATTKNARMRTSNRSLRTLSSRPQRSQPAR